MNDATVFLFKKITQITGIHKYASTGAENTFHPLEKFGHIIQPSDHSVNDSLTFQDRIECFGKMFHQKG